MGGEVAILSLSVEEVTVGSAVRLNRTGLWSGADVVIESGGRKGVVILGGVSVGGDIEVLEGRRVSVGEVRWTGNMSLRSETGEISLYSGGSSVTVGGDGPAVRIQTRNSTTVGGNGQDIEFWAGSGCGGFSDALDPYYGSGGPGGRGGDVVLRGGRGGGGGQSGVFGGAKGAGGEGGSVILIGGSAGESAERGIGGESGLGLGGEVSVQAAEGSGACAVLRFGYATVVSSRGSG